jgi:hypothetical protein
MLRIADIASRDGVSTAAVSKSVKRLVEQHELIVERDGRGRVVKVNVAHYDDLRSKFSDPSKVQAAKPDQDVSYDKALAEKTSYDAERSRLRLMVETGNLVERERIEHAMDDAGLRIGRAIDQMAANVDELAAAYENAGIQGLRLKLKELVHATRDQVADVLDAAAAEAPELGAA